MTTEIQKFCLAFFFPKENLLFKKLPQEGKNDNLSTKDDQDEMGA